MYHYLNPLPAFMNGTAAKWTYVSLSALAALPGQFNRSALEAPWATDDVSDSGLSQTSVLVLLSFFSFCYISAFPNPSPL
jgi:gluconolactonase